MTAIILAGGKSRRMGTDKALLEIEGISLLNKAIQLCEQVCDTIIISSNHSGHKVFSYPVVADEIANCGPLGGIYSCLRKSQTQWNFVISVDAAFVEPEFIRYLHDFIEPVDAIVPYTHRGKEPLISLYNKSGLECMEEKLLSGCYKIHDLLEAFNTKFINAEDWESNYPDLFRNLNRPDDLN